MPIRPARAIVLALLVIAPALTAQEAQKYILPPPNIVAAFDAEPLPQTVLSPNKQVVALIKARSYPTIAELAQPMLRLAGERVNPKTNGPHRASGLPGTGIYSITLKKISDGAEAAVTMPPQARVSHVKFSPDGSRLAFLNTKEGAIELWIADASTGSARAAVTGADRINATTGDPCDWLRDNVTMVCELVPAGRGPAPVEPIVPSGPNVGFAWNPHLFGMTGTKTVIRGGFRITYDPAYYNMFLNVATAAPIVNAGVITTATCTAPCLPTSGFLGSDVRSEHLGDIPRGVNPGRRNYTQVAPNFHEPYTQSWSLGVQHEISSRIVFESRYVGNRVVGNFQTVNANPSLAGLIDNGFSSFIPSGVTPCATSGTPGFASERADCNFTNVRNRENTAFSTYHGLQSELRLRNFHGLSGGFSYTFSKTLDNASEIFSTFSGGNTVAGAQNPFDISKGERALSGLDFPNTASIYFVYELPFFKAQKGFLGHVLGGYQASGTWRYSIGQLCCDVKPPSTGPNNGRFQS